MASKRRRDVRIVGPIALLVALLLASLTGPTLAADSDEADRQFTFAARLMQRGEPGLAAEAFNEFIKDYADDPRVDDAHYYLALLARKRGDREAALRHAERVEDPLNVKGWSLALLRGQLKLETGDAEAAVAELEAVDGDALPSGEARAQWSYLLGTAYRGAGNRSAAADQFAKAAEAGSAVRGRALLELGKARLELDEPGAALEALREALDADLSSDRAAEAASLAADLAYRQQQHGLAANLYGRVVQRHQSSEHFKPAAVGLLRALYANGRNDELIRRHDALRDLLPAEARGEALYLLAAARVRQGEYAEAAEALGRFHQRHGHDHPLAGEVAYLSAVCFYQTDNLEGFERWVARAEQEVPNLPHSRELRYLRAQAAVKAGRHAEAVEHLNPLIDKPNAPYAKRALLQRAALRENLNRASDAAADYALYAERYGDDARAPQARRRAVALAFRAGRFQRVVELAEPWLKEEAGKDGRNNTPELTSVRFRLGVARLKLSQPDAAMEEFKKLLDQNPRPEIAAYAHYYRGLLLADRAEASERQAADALEPAIEALEKATDGPLPEGERVEATALIARLHRQAGREDKALEAYQWLRDHQPLQRVRPGTAVWVGRGLHDRQKHEDALPWLEAAAEREDAPPETRAEAMFLAARCHQQLEQWEPAIETYRRLVAFSHGYGDQGRLGLAQSLAGAGETEEALNEYDGLIDAEASRVAATALLESAALRHRRADRLASAGNPSAAARARETARKHLHRILILHDVPELRTLGVRARLTLGRLEAAVDQPDKARKHLDEAIDRAAGDSPWHDAARAERLLVDGRRSEALHLLRRIVKESGNEEAEADARRRLRQLGEAP